MAIVGYFLFELDDESQGKSFGFEADDATQ